MSGAVVGAPSRYARVSRLSVVGAGQELLLIGRDLRQSVRRDLSSVLLRKTGSHELIKQCDSMVEAL